MTRTRSGESPKRLNFLQEPIGSEDIHSETKCHARQRHNNTSSSLRVYTAVTNEDIQNIYVQGHKVIFLKSTNPSTTPCPEHKSAEEDLIIRIIVIIGYNKHPGNNVLGDVLPVRLIWERHVSQARCRLYPPNSASSEVCTHV
jgi:hypothetical protein